MAKGLSKTFIQVGVVFFAVFMFSQVTTAASNGRPGPQGHPGPSGSHGPFPRTQPAVIGVNCGNGHTIQEALNRGLIPGDTVLVSGTCKENIDILEHIQSITLDGQGTATIEGKLDDITLLIRGRGITIRGLYIKGGACGITLSRGASATIDANDISLTAAQAILVNNNSTAFILNNRIHDNFGLGIFIQESSDAQIGYYVTYSLTSASPGVVSVQNAAPNYIYNNNGDGILVRIASSARIFYSQIYGNSGWGISVRNTSSAEIKSNTISNNAGGTIFIDPSSSSLQSMNN